MCTCADIQSYSQTMKPTIIHLFIDTQELWDCLVLEKNKAVKACDFSQELFRTQIRLVLSTMRILTRYIKC